jgi:hypothetical protein
MGGGLNSLADIQSDNIGIQKQNLGGLAPSKGKNEVNPAIELC